MNYNHRVSKHNGRPDIQSIGTQRNSVSSPKMGGANLGIIAYIKPGLIYHRNEQPYA